jgi:hypothetical protein
MAEVVAEVVAELLLLLLLLLLILILLLLIIMIILLHLHLLLHTITTIFLLIWHSSWLLCLLWVEVMVQLCLLRSPLQIWVSNRLLFHLFHLLYV